MKSALLYLLLLSSFILTACTGNDSAGNTMETENSIAFQVILPDGKSAAKKAYRMRPAWYLADTTSITDSSGFLTGTADTKGWIRIKNAPLGSYILEVVDQAVGGVLHFVHQDTTGPEAQYQMILDTLGCVRGKVVLPKGVASAWVQVYGLSASTSTDKDGNFLLTELPVGNLRIAAWDPSNNILLSEMTFLVSAGDTVGLGLLPTPQQAIEDESTWPYAQVFDPNTLISDWMLPLQYPTIVTLRLHAENHDFSNANSHGRDLRVFTQAGRSIPLHMVRYDLQNELATVRLRVEDASDLLGTWTLRWGKSRVMDISSPQIWQGFSDSLLFALNTVQVDHFDSAWNRNALPEPIGTSFWFITLSDSNAKMDSVLRKDFTKNIVVDPTGERSGKVLHIQYQANSPSWIIAGTTVGESFHSLYTLDSIEFWLRGNGTVSLAMESNIHEVLGNKAWIHLQADSVWKRIAIKPSDFLKGDSIGGNYGWEAVRDSITNLSWFATNGSEFWLDDIRMYGVSRDDLK